MKNSAVATVLSSAFLAFSPHFLHAETANTAAAVTKCLETSKKYAACEAVLVQSGDLPVGRDAAKAALGKLMTSARTFPHDVGTPVMEAVCAGLLSIGDLQNYAKVRAQLSDPKALEAAVSIPCPDCGGQPLDPETCHKCGGSGSCPNPKCQEGRQVMPRIAGTAPVVTACMTCKGTMKCPDCKGKGTVGATCPRCRGKGQVLDKDNARDIFRQYMDMAIAASRARQVVLVEAVGRGQTAAAALRQACLNAAEKVHGKNKVQAAIGQGMGVLVRAYAPVGIPKEGDDGFYSLKVKVCVAKTLPQAVPAAGDDDHAFDALGDAW